jgi:hypothetical protein
VKVLADENLFQPIIEHLRSLGHDVLDAREAGLLAASDEEVYRRGVQDKRVIGPWTKTFFAGSDTHRSDAAESSL